MKQSSKDKHHGLQLAEGVILGGFTSIIALDVAQLCYYALDPVAHSCVSYLAPPNASGAAATATNAAELTAVPSEHVPYLAVSKLIQEEKKKDKEDEKRRDVWKRVIRIILLVALGYLIAGML